MENVWSEISNTAKRNNIHQYSLVTVNNFKIDKIISQGSLPNRADENTKFQAASLSKTVTAVIILILAEQNKLSLTAAAGTYLKSWNPEPHLKVSIKQLLTHTGGISVPGFDGYEQGQKLPTLNQILNGVQPADSPRILRKYKPGKYRYSGGGFMILQKIIEDVSGENFSKISDRLLFRPLSMRKSNFDVIATDKNDHQYPESAAAGLWSTSSDFATFLIEIGLALKGEGRVLSKNSAHAMVREYLPGVGLGTFVHRSKKRIQFTHDGANFGYRARYIFFSNGNGAVIMTKSDDFKFIDEVVRLIGKEHDWGSFKVKI